MIRPAQTVLWGGRGIDVQVGSERDRLRCARLDREATRRRVAVAIGISFVDAVAAMRRFDQALREVAGVMRRIPEARS